MSKTDILNAKEIEKNFSTKVENEKIRAQWLIESIANMRGAHETTKVNQKQNQKQTERRSPFDIRTSRGD